jgi:outer membrane protein assembly factor BamB
LSGFAFQVPAQPTLANGLLYLQPNDGNLYALNASNGTMMWTGTVGMDLGFGSLPTGGAVIADGVVYAGSTAGSVTAFNLTSALAAAKQLAAPDRTKLRPTRSLKATPSDAS